MKKALPAVALTLAIVSSWAFYPKDAPQAQYMVVIGTTRAGGIGTNISEVITIEPDGRQQSLPVDTKANRTMGSSSLLLRRAELFRLNQLAGEGWHLVNVMQNPQGTANETTYVLEKR